MKITATQLRKIIKEEILNIKEHNASSVGAQVEPEKDIVLWVNNPNRTVRQLIDAHHELTQGAYGVSSKAYVDVEELSLSDIEELKSEIIKLQNEPVESLDQDMMNEAMSRITPDEVEAWKSGNWAYVSGDESAHAEPMEMGVEDPNRFLHGKDGHDDEGAMVKSRLHLMKDMAKDICDVVRPEDQLPGWVQDHISVAHENLQQVHGYLIGKQHSMEHGHEQEQEMEIPVMESKKTLSEAHNRVTREEMDAWMRGDWGFVSEENE